MKKEQITILLVGIGGYGNVYIKEILNSSQRANLKLAGVVDPNPKNCTCLDQIRERNIPIFNTMEEFYSQYTADLAVIVSPIHFHCQHTCLALSHGSCVLCEKPLSATVQEAFRMLEARDKYKRFVAIGYQWSFSNAILSLKKDIMEGLLGKPRRLKTLALKPRDSDYFSRSWAGKKQDDKGNWILDSVANNSTSHYLHNMFYILGREINQSVNPRYVTAELYRANDIQNFDTSVIRVITDDGTELLHYASHATNDELNPVFCYEFEKAVVTYGESACQDDRCIRAVFNDGTVKSYGDPGEEPLNKLWAAIDAIKRRKPIPCGIEAALSQTLSINGTQDSMKDITEFPKSIVMYDEEMKLTWVEGLSDILKDCYTHWEMPNEAGVSWAKPGIKIDLAGYRCFKGESEV